MADIVTDLAAVKTWMGLTVVDNDTVLQVLINDVQAAFVREMGREVEGATFTEVVEKIRPFDSQITLRHPPITSITSVKQSTSWDFASATAMATDAYDLNPDSGVVYFNRELQEGRRTLQVVYAGGMSANAAAFAAAYPDIHQAANLQVDHQFRRRKTPGSTSESAQGSSKVWTGEVQLLKTVRTTLGRYNRRIRP